MKESVKGIQGDTGKPGRWFKDEEAANTDGFPILFVHGINTSSETWLSDNDMLRIIRGAGYQSLFIDLHKDEDMWTNGEILADKIREMYDSLKEKLVIVGHSKGGIDAQAALIHYGASPYVERVITLSTPHHGSELADLAFSKWAGWLTDALKSKTPAVFSLQTGYMRGFRSEMDEHDLAKSIPFYTFGGTGWGGAQTELFWGGLYLSRFGQSDGAVLVKSSRLPYGKEVEVRDWTHKTIKEGSEIFPYMKGLFLDEVKDVNSAEAINHLTEEETSFLHRGGAVDGMGVESFAVEEGVERLTINWVSNQRDTLYELVGPDGQVYKQWGMAEDATGFFPGAFHHTHFLSDPIPGRWEVKAHTCRKEHYMLSILFHKKPAVVSLSKNDQISRKTYTIHHIPMKSVTKPSTLITSEDLSSLPLADFGEGIHNITLDLEGKTVDGNEYQRTVIQTVYVDGKGNIY
ncbi:esterase/lipase family protein [Rossellomorea sp. NPDC077527]|uniref:esterase/lipase family protein n=1 Tax=Rossellomorea sp. NPDC077527 TaxID=3364510 RepID=UPI0037C64E49